MNPLVEGLKKMLGEERLRALSEVKLGIGGAGGLGSNVAAHLVRSGFKDFIIVDFDKVEPTNLNRQFFFADQVGLFKVEALAENLLRINQELNISTLVSKVTKENVWEIFKECDIWVEAFDGAESKRMFVEQALIHGKKVVSASGLAGWGNSDAILTRRWGSNLIVVGDQLTEVGVNTPPMSPRVGVAAAKEADIVISWILGGEV